MRRTTRPRVRTWTTGALLVLAGWAACRDEGASEQKVPSTAVETPAEPPASAVRWRFVPTLEQHLSTEVAGGAVGEMVLELSQPRQYQVVILAAVLRAKAEHVELERWTFAQSPDGQSLQLVESGEPMLRLRAGTRNPKLDELRRALAAPGVVLTRPVGLPSEGSSTNAFLAELATAFATLRDAKAEPRARVQAAAVVVRALDDTVVFERDAIWEVAELLDPLPEGLVVQAIGERRARAELPHAGGTAVLELQRKSDGWAIASVERPRPAIEGMAREEQPAPAVP